METPQDRARQLGITTPAAAAQTVQPVPSVPVSTTKEDPMSTNNTNTAATVPSTTNAPAAPAVDMQAVMMMMMQQMQQMQAQIAAQSAAVVQTQPTPATTPVLAAETPKPPEKKPFSLGRPAKPYIPEKIEIYAPCKKDDAGKLTDTPNGTLCFHLGTNSKISLGWDEWQIVLEQFESGLVREMMAECAKTGQKQQWKL